MQARVATLGLTALVLVGCPSKEGERKDANAGGGAAKGGATAAAAATGPLANLEGSPFMNEVWNAAGQRFQVLYYTRENVRVSAQCRSADGRLACDALKQIRGAPPVELPKVELDGRMSAGVKACMRLRYTIVSAMDPNGNEDSFCRFPDGSLLAAGTLEQYGMRVLE